MESLKCISLTARSRRPHLSLPSAPGPCSSRASPHFGRQAVEEKPPACSDSARWWLFQQLLRCCYKERDKELRLFERARMICVIDLASVVAFSHSVSVRHCAISSSPASLHCRHSFGRWASWPSCIPVWHWVFIRALSLLALLTATFVQNKWSFRPLPSSCLPRPSGADGQIRSYRIDLAWQEQGVSM